ncbi:MAG TPA: SDR family NAD(P)-dependent oxidoreductase, partial [Hymenobacter sp.]
MKTNLSTLALAAETGHDSSRASPQLLVLNNPISRAQAAALPYCSVAFALLLGLLGLALGGCATAKPSAAIQQKVKGKTYVILGASSGFGRGMALQLGAAKANVVLAARRTELLEEVATQVRAAGGTALVVTTDISQPEQVQHLAEAAVKQYGRVDIWVNDAGVGGIGRFWEIPL